MSLHDSILQSGVPELETAVIYDGLDDAVLGYDSDLFKLIYSADKIIEILQEDQGMSYDEAVDYYCYNIDCLYAGEQTPILIWEF
jgi:hypothetical protein